MVVGCGAPSVRLPPSHDRRDRDVDIKLNWEAAAFFSGDLPPAKRLPAARPPTLHLSRFMSISPIDAQSPATSSPARAPVANPSPDHGSLRHSRQRGPRHIGPSVGGGAPSAFLSRASAGRPESPIASNVEFCYSATRVIGPRLPVTRHGAHDEGGDTTLECPPTGSDWSSTQFGSSQLGIAQANCTQSGDDHLSHPEGLSAQTTFQGIAVPTARRNHVINANHLLNFHYDPISRTQPRAPPPRRQQKIKPYNKDLFLQANYKFVVIDRGGFQVESIDPDKMVPWEDVICLRYSTPLLVQCPICLETPLCPQITSCGHLYCFPCILQYMLMGEVGHKGNNWKKCPLCFTMICVKDLCTVLIDNVSPLSVGNHVDLTLLTRAKCSLFPTLKEPQVGNSMPYNSHDLFSKFILTSDVEISVREAKLDLSEWLVRANSGLVDDLEKLPYVCAALDQLEERMKNWVEQYNCSSIPHKDHAPDSADRKMSCIPNRINSHISKSNLNFRTTGSDSCEETSHKACSILDQENVRSGTSPLGGSLTPLASASELLTNSEKILPSKDEDDSLKQNSSSVTDKDSYTFYQASDGQLIILHPLNMKCLLHHYGSYNMLPPRIKGKVLELETVTQSEATRRRYRYLSHFSLTTAFQFCEIDLSNFLPSSSLTPFMDEINKREKMRKQLAREEANERARAEAAVLHVDQRLSGVLREKDVLFSSDDFEALGNNPAPSTSPPVTGERKLFSDVTRLGFAAAHDSPSLRVEEADEISRNISNTSNNEGPRTTTLSFANIISSSKAAESRETHNTGAMGKKGKKPSKVLLSTSGGRRY